VLAQQMAHPRRWRVLHDLREHGARLHAETEVLEIEERAVRFRSMAPDAEAERVDVDSVVIAEGLVGNPEGVAVLESAGVPVRVIGDASGVGYIDGAIADGFRAALELG